jgi:molybdopterin synthase catalytic subunit
VSRLVALRETALSVDEAIDSVRRSSSGGIAVFLGTVRDHNEGQAVTVLEYEAYATMAEKELSAIADEIEREIPGVALAVLHRVGRLQVGDVAVVCAASSPHRDEAFRACRELIERTKARVPIWKREHGPAGSHWVGWTDARISTDKTAR